MGRLGSANSGCRVSCSGEVSVAPHLKCGAPPIQGPECDWNANALAKAKSYQETMAMSPESIREQLTSEYGEQFTAEEADFAIQHLNG
ncbi:Ltp family lipoprotein [Cryobacterium sp. TMT1-21]|uniref:Ltp family lipoprotein n=1 Tax=Cryobacterium sp. TMT1-21 TaxID=1259234 RepID=UPI0018E09D82|nr:Ltp family lipoprotein [Cryobacterium sp. TMT1-21]